MYKKCDIIYLSSQRYVVVMAVKKKYNNKSKKKNIKINKEIILEKNLINN